MSVFAARMTPGSSDWLALGDGRYGNELRQQQKPMPPTLSQRHVRPASCDETEYTVVSVKPDPDNAFQHVGGLPHVDELYQTASRAYNHRGSWLSSSQSFHEVSQHQMSRLSDTSTSWPVIRQRFPDTRDAVVAPALQENYAASRPTPDKDEYSQRRCGSPGEVSGHEPWGFQKDQSRQSPAPPPPTSVNSDQYRTAPGHHQAAEFNTYRPGADEDGGDQSSLYRPRKLLADFYRHRQRQDQHHRQQQQDVGVEASEDGPMGKTGRWVKAASAYDGSPPAESQSAEASNFFNGRRQTWPNGTSVVPVVRRRQPQQTADQYVDYAEEDVGRPAIPQQSAAAAAAAGATASPISRLIQRYDHTAVTTSAGDAVPSSHQSPTSGRGEWFPMSWQPPVNPSTTAIDTNSTSTDNSSEHGEGTKTYSCHICSYIGDSKHEFDAHMRLHFDHRCPFCDYSSRTEGRLRCHIKTFHADGGLCSAAPGPVADHAAKRKPKIITCQKCGFKAKEKEELWIHRRQHHMSADKVLECPRCPFATELRHHLEYHLRSHYGSRPYKCDKCTYRCYNQSMLNSHAKSHTNVYQFRCADCQFAAKYCHSLKVHLRQNPTHTAAPVLNEDGSVPVDGSGDFEVMSRRGRPRGPRAPRRMTRPRLSRPPMTSLPPPSQALPLTISSNADPISSVQYSEHARGPPPVMSSFPVNDETRRIDGGVFPLLPPAFAADFAANQRSRRAIPFQTNSSSEFRQRTDNAGHRDDRIAGFSSSPSLYLPARMDLLDSSMMEDCDSRHCRSYSPSTFDQRLMPPAAASAKSQGSELAPATAYNHYGVAVVSSPMSEPEPALGGHLPLDLTAKSRTEDPRALIPTEPEASSWSPDDITAYRPRRHYETWKQGSRPRSGGEPTIGDSDVSTASDVYSEVGVAHIQPEQKVVVEQAHVGEPTDETSPPAKRGRLSTDDEERVTDVVATGSPASGADGSVGGGRYQCSHCEIEFFGSRVLHAMHMAFHGPVDPFQCSQCGVRTADRVDFFLHLARAAHS